MVVVGPELMKRQPPQIGMIGGYQAEQVVNLTFVKAGGEPARRQRRKVNLAFGQQNRGDHEQIVSGQFEDVAQIKSAERRARVFRENQFRMSRESVANNVGKDQ